MAEQPATVQRDQDTPAVTSSPNEPSAPKDDPGAVPLDATGGPGVKPTVNPSTTTPGPTRGPPPTRSTAKPDQESVEQPNPGSSSSDPKVNATSGSNPRETPSSTSASPPSSGRTIILCFDGTGNKFGKNSNVIRFMNALVKDQPDKQVIYYQPGIGTYLSKKYFTYTFSWIFSKLDSGFAVNLAEHVKDGYKFLMKNHRPGDKICLLGFSRGAYTARALAGMIYKVGVLLPDNDEQLDFAYQVYSATDLESAFRAREFKDIFSLAVKVHFLGVWDTVASVGIIPRSLPYSTQNDGVIYFRHALALDERRARFRPNLWGEPITEREELDTVPELDPIPMSDDSWVYTPPKTTDVKEVWFAGAHADVGGGSHPTYYSTSLSRIPLRWMIRECFVTKTQILFDEDRLKKCSELELAELQQEKPEFVPIHNIPSTSYAHLQSWFTKVTITDNVLDILSDLFDQLHLVLIWWIIEFLPLVWTFQKTDGTWSRWRRRNFGNGRWLPEADEHIFVHESVRDRITTMNGKYWPKAINWGRVKDTVEWEK